MNGISQSGTGLWHGIGEETCPSCWKDILIRFLLDYLFDRDTGDRVPLSVPLRFTGIG